MPIEQFVDAAKGSSHGLLDRPPARQLRAARAPASAIETTMPRVLASLRERGFKGVEAYYGGTDEATRELMVKLDARRRHDPTGGSDYHGHYKEDVVPRRRTSRVTCGCPTRSSTS